MKTKYLKHRKTTFLIRLLVFISLIIMIIMLTIPLFSGEFSDFIKLTDESKATYGAVIGLSLTVSYILLRLIISDYKGSIEYKYEKMLQETELKYSIINKELNRQKIELQKLIKEKEKNELLEERLFSVEEESLKLQEQKYFEIRELLEYIQRTERAKTAANNV